jgi:hypothetical protein
MSWKNVTPMEEIIRFVMLAQSARFTVSDQCGRIESGPIEPAG